MVAGEDAPTSEQPHRLDARGLVEAGRVGRSPVQQDGLTVVVPQSDAADVLDASVGVVDATEAQALPSGRRRGQLLGKVVEEGLALEEVLRRPGAR